MAKARAIIKRRGSVQNIRKITRTMELIATARFKKALDRAVQAEAFTRKIAELVSELGERTGGDVKHPLLEVHKPQTRALLLVLSSNRGLAGGYNSNVLRAGFGDYQDLQTDGYTVNLEVSGKRGISFLKFRGIQPDTTYTYFEDKPEFNQVALLAEKYLKWYENGEIDRLDVVYTRFVSTSKQLATVETLLPMSTADVAKVEPSKSRVAGVVAGEEAASAGEAVPYEFLPDPKSILEEIVPIAFKVRLLKCFLDSAVSEQISRMVAMRGATENADQMVTSLTRLYNRARQSQITRELAEIIGGAAALE